MNLFGAWKKLILFGFFGAVGCLAGWAIGEAYLAIAQAALASSGASQAPTLISNSNSSSSEPPPLSSAFQERLAKAGAHTGDVQMSLIWFNTNDLDLHCIDPSGFEISWQNKLSPTHGELDVDRNAGCRNPTAEPVENIYWATGTAPMGRYQVFVDYYQQCANGTDETRYQVNVLQSGERREFSGTIKKDETGARKKMIYEFQIHPLVVVAAPPDFQLHRGTQISLPVAVRRSFFAGKLELKAANLPEGVTAKTLTLDPGKNDGTLELKASNGAALGARIPLKIVASAPDAADVHGSADVQMDVLDPPFSLVQTVVIGVWTALLAVGLCLALVMGQNRYLGRPLLARGRIPLVLVILGASVAGFVSGSIGQSLFALFLSIGVERLGSLIGWILLGGFLGLGISYFVPNLDRKKAGIAGLVGGLLGAIAYVAISAEMLGRFAGAGLLGFCIGLMVAIVEAAFRRTWLEVRYGERETISVNLGPEPVKIGGDARACTIWARGAASVALRYFVRDGRVICEDATTRRESIVGNGDTRTVGPVTLVVHAGTVVPRALPAALPIAEPVPARAPVLPTPRAEPRPAPAPISRPTPATADPPAPRAVAPPAPKPPPAAPKPPAPAATNTAKPPVPVPARAEPPKPASPPGNATAKPPVPGTKPPPATVAPPKPPVPANRPPSPVSPKPVAPAANTKPPLPAALPKPAAPAAKPPKPPPTEPLTPIAAAKPGDPNACPTCGRVTPGRPGARFCMMCDKTY